eukprot:PLAT16140.1.p1 GENE.PLAT16140.1~~PLAT16140.1.p1  ORF type:complete len:195 (+),score=70.34 PLAT16140.1:1-585(+)
MAEAKAAKAKPAKEARGFSRSHIKKLVKMTHAGIVEAQVPELIAHTTEMFLAAFAADVVAEAQAGKKQILTYDHVRAAVKNKQRMEFLTPVFPPKRPRPDGDDGEEKEATAGDKRKRAAKGGAAKAESAKPAKKKAAESVEETKDDGKSTSRTVDEARSAEASSKKAKTADTSADKSDDSTAEEPPAKKAKTGP